MRYYRHVYLEQVVGLRLPGARNGDVIAMLFGYSVPFVLRRMSIVQLPRVYQLIGKVYLHI
jgi:hypothetical protein